VIRTGKRWIFKRSPPTPLKKGGKKTSIIGDFWRFLVIRRVRFLRTKKTRANKKALDKTVLLINGGKKTSIIGDFWRFLVIRRVRFLRKKKSGQTKSS